MYNFWNLSLLLDCQLLIFPVVYATGQGTFFSITQVPDGVLFWSAKKHVLKHFKKLKFKILSFLVFQISSDMSLSIFKVGVFEVTIWK